ncbi:MAG: ComEC/Rec2 family competence protein, partial [Bacteroidales bacterium]
GEGPTVMAAAAGDSLVTTVAAAAAGEGPAVMTAAAGEGPAGWTEWGLPVLFGITFLAVILFLAGLWILRKDRGYKHIRTGMPVVLVPRFISRTQLRYRYGRSLYRVGLISLFCLAAWNGWLGSGPEGSVLPEGEQLYICLKVIDFPTVITTAAGKRYQRMECSLFMYSPDGYQHIKGRENMVVYVADSTGPNGSSGNPVREPSSWRPGDILMTRCRSYPFRSIQSAERQQETVPAQMRTEAPAQTSTEAPAQMRTEAPAQTSTEAPAQTSTEAPAQMRTEAPAQTSTEAPAQMRTDASAFDYATYMARRGFFRQAYVYQYRRGGERPTLADRLRRLRVPLTGRWKGEAGALLSGICLGDRSGISREIRDRFTAAGAGHILAVSGLHVGVLYGSFVLLLGVPRRIREERRYRKSPSAKQTKPLATATAATTTATATATATATVIATAASAGPPNPFEMRSRQLALYRIYSISGGVWVHIPALLLIWTYAAVVGFSASVVRAALMLSIYGVGKMCGHRTFGLNVLCITALILVVLRPVNLFDPGFQLSFSAVLGLMLFFPLFRNLLSTRNVILKYLWELFCCSLAVQAGTLWLSAGMFGVIPLYGLLCNFVVVPLCGVILYAFLAYLLLLGSFSLLSCAAVSGTVIGSLAVPVENALEHITGGLHHLAGTLDVVVAFFAHLPGTPILFQPGPAGQLLMFMGAGILYFLLRRISEIP